MKRTSVVHSSLPEPTRGPCVKMACGKVDYDVKNKFVYFRTVACWSLGLFFSLRLIHVWCRVCCRRSCRRRARRCLRSCDLCLLFRRSRELKRRPVLTLSCWTRPHHQTRLCSILPCKFIYTARTLP